MEGKNILFSEAVTNYTWVLDKVKTKLQKSFEYQHGLKGLMGKNIQCKPG